MLATPDVAIIRDGHAGRLQQAAGHDRGDRIVRSQFSDAIVAHVGDVNIAKAVGGQPERVGEARGGAGALGQAISAGQPGDICDHAIEPDKADGVVARIGHDQAAPRQDEALRVIEASLAAGAVGAARRLGGGARERGLDAGGDVEFFDPIIGGIADVDDAGAVGHDRERLGEVGHNRVNALR